MDGIRITRLRIANYRGVKAVDAKVGRAGLVVKGENGSGKTSVLRAIRAALIAQDVSTEAIRHDEEKAEILVEMGAGVVARTIDADGQHLHVKANGKELRAPQRWLTELVGSSPIDPLEFFRQKPKERLKTVLEAIPLKADPPTLISGIPAQYRAGLPEITAEDHALVACAKLTSHFFDRRTEENRIVRAQEAVLAARPVAFSVPDDPRPQLAKAQGQVAELRGLWARAEQGRAAREKTEARVRQLSSEADEHEARANLPTELGTIEGRIEGVRKAHDAARGQQAELRTSFDSAGRKVVSLRDLLREAEAEADAIRAKIDSRQSEMDSLGRQLAELQRHRVDRDTNVERAGAARAQANELSRTLASTDMEPERGAIEAAEKRARDMEAKVEEYLSAAAEAEKYSSAEKLVQSAQTVAADLTRLVDRYREELPRALLKAACTIKGLSIDGDRILLDGVDIEAACGKERMELAVEVARRANVKSKIIIVDGLEAIDPDHFVNFVKMATRDHYQLIGTRVDAGDMVLEALEIDGGG